MDVIEGLKTQHRVAEHLFKEIKSAHAPEAKERLFRELAEKLNEHMTFEESTFYPAVENVDPSLVEHSFEEHAASKPLLSELLGLKGSSQEFAEKLAKLKDMIQEHVQEEEQTLFPKCLEQLDEPTLTQLGLDLEDWIRQPTKDRGGSDVPMANMSPS